MTDTPRYSSLRDYLGVIRSQRVLIVLVAAVFAAAALAVSLRQDEQYVAAASLAFRDLSQDADLLGTPANPVISADQRAALNAALLTRREVAEAVARQLGTRRSPDQLRGAISARVEAQTNLVVVEARWGEPEFAARLANAFATQAGNVATRSERRRFARAANTVRAGIGRRSPQGQFSRQLALDRIARLESLAQFASPVQSVRRAAVPARPFSPRPVRNTILGLLVGLTLGIIAAFVRDSLDRRFRGAQDIKNELDLPVLGHVRNEVMGRSIVSPNGRKAITEADLEAFRILRTNLDFLDVDRRLKSVAVTSALPEEGKSTVSSSLAWASAAGGRSTLIVECDLRRPTLAERFGLEPSPGLTDYLAGRVGPQDILQTVTRHQPTLIGDEESVATDDADPQLVCIVAGSPTPRPAELLGSERFASFIEQVSEVYDLVVVDTSPLLSVVDTLEVLPKIDGVIMCVRAAQTTRDQAHAAKTALSHLPQRPTGVVVTGVRPGDDTDYGYYSYSYAYGSRTS